MKVLLWPHTSLRKKCLSVDLEKDQKVIDELEQMKKLMVDSNGLGLAANQVGLNKRMLVARAQGKLFEFVNPRILDFTGVWTTLQEGCLSIPGVFLDMKRNTKILVEAADPRTGNLFGKEYSGELAHILQHEIDHLDGKTMVDKLPSGRKDLIRLHLKNLRKSR